MQNRTHYQILGISDKATLTEISKAFKKKAIIYHPDKNTDGEEEFKKINEAYQILTNSEKRAEYDRALKNLFGEIFGDGGKREAKKQLNDLKKLIPQLMISLPFIEKNSFLYWLNRIHQIGCKIESDDEKNGESFYIPLNTSVLSARAFICKMNILVTQLINQVHRNKNKNKNIQCTAFRQTLVNQLKSIRENIEDDFRIPLEKNFLEKFNIDLDFEYRQILACLNGLLEVSGISSEIKLHSLDLFDLDLEIQRIEEIKLVKFKDDSKKEEFIQSLKNLRTLICENLNTQNGQKKWQFEIPVKDLRPKHHLGLIDIKNSDANQLAIETTAMLKTISYEKFSTNPESVFQELNIYAGKCSKKYLNYVDTPKTDLGKAAFVVLSMAVGFITTVFVSLIAGGIILAPLVGYLVKDTIIKSFRDRAKRFTGMEPYEPISQYASFKPKPLPKAVKQVHSFFANSLSIQREKVNNPLSEKKPSTNYAYPISASAKF